MDPAYRRADCPSPAEWDAGAKVAGLERRLRLTRDIEARCARILCGALQLNHWRYASTRITEVR